jgi:hypothetical protein
VYTTGPNGQVDGNASNDDRTATFGVSDPGEVVTLEIKLDDYGSETTWEITPQGGSWVIDNGGPYQDNQSGTVVSSDLCLSSGCYTFRVEDAYGDGMCCQFGDGDYWVLSSTGDTLANGTGNFGSSSTVTFCLENVGIATTTLDADLRLWPNPGTGAFEIQLGSPSKDPVLIEVRDALGRLVAQRTLASGSTRSTLDLSGLAEGSYAVVASRGNERSVQRLVIQR